jgi:DNA-directed RNA polymerase specialized sigma24 family protein
MRVRRREDARGHESLEPDGAVARMAAWDDPHSALDRKEKMAQIKAALDVIAPDRREAVSAHLSGFDVAEIMRRHGWSYHKARNLVARGMADMRRVLEENGWGPAQPPAERPTSSLALKARAYQAKLRMLGGPRLKHR